LAVAICIFSLFLADLPEAAAQAGNRRFLQMPVCRQGRKENDISYDIRGTAFKIHNELSLELLESVYETALSYELELMGYTIRRQVGIPGSAEK
jgi:hypothetical protein